MTRIPVWGEDAAFRAAIAQLADRVRPATGPTGAAVSSTGDAPSGTST